MREDVTIDVVLASTTGLAADLTHCWMEVANRGGAVGFPFLPVTQTDVNPAVREMLTEVERGEVVLLTARLEALLVGWVTLRLNSSDLTAHWATIERLQSHPDHRGMGIGPGLLARTSVYARELGLEHLHLVVRGGEGLESFYDRYGWIETGRHRRALRLKVGDDRDEVAMTLNLAAPSCEVGSG